MKRNPLLTKMRLVAIIFGALVSGITFIRLNEDYASWPNWIATIGFLLISPIGVLMTSFTPIALSFPLERAVFLKQQNSKLYSTFSYFMSRNILDLPYAILSPIIISLIVYWMVGLSSTPQQFFIYLLTMICTAFNGSSLGLLIGSVVTDPKSVSIASPLIFQPCILFAGFFKNLSNLPAWIGWVQFLSPIKYGFAAMVQNQVQYGYAPYLGALNLNTSLWLSIGLSFGLGLGFRAASLYFLWRLRSKVQ